MKKIASFEQGIGGDGATAKGVAGVTETALRLEIAFEYPIEKIIDPILKVVDDLVDRLERVIPGDQIAMAEKAKADARAAIITMIYNQAK